MVQENRAHRSHSLNPRKHPRGSKYFNRSKGKIIERLTRITLLSEDEMYFIHDVPRLLGKGLYANLGHAFGGSAILMAESLKENDIRGKIYSVDLFSSNKQIRNAISQIEIYNVEQQIELCFGSTDEWADTLRDMRFNFVFIDADHTYKAVRGDFLNWAPLVGAGGWISFHDTNQDFSYKAISDTVEKLKNWEELKDYHIDRIRTFKKITT